MVRDCHHLMRNVHKKTKQSQQNTQKTTTTIFFIKKSISKDNLNFFTFEKYSEQGRQSQKMFEHWQMKMINLLLNLNQIYISPIIIKFPLWVHSWFGNWISHWNTIVVISINWSQVVLIVWSSFYFYLFVSELNFIEQTNRLTYRSCFQ